MNKTFKLLAVLGVIMIVTWATVGTYQNCKVNYRIAEYKRELKLAKDSAEVARKVYDDVLKVRNSEIQRLNVIITEASLVVTELEGDIAGRDVNIARLNGALALLPNVDTVVILRERVDILTETVEQWKEKFVLSAAIIAQKDTQIFALSEKYNQEHRAHIALTVAYNELHEYNQGLVRFNTELKIAYNQNRLFGTLKSGGLIAAGIVIVYTVLKGSEK